MNIFRSILSSVHGLADWVFSSNSTSQQDDWQDDVTRELRNHGRNFNSELPADTEMDRLVKTIERMKGRNDMHMQ
jgi:hypothetical protein